MKIVLITGSYPPDVCGSADYTARLEESLRRAGAEVEVFTGKRWTIRNAPALTRELATLRPDIMHMQYPTAGYGWTLGPQMMSLLQPMVLTLHEASQGHPLRKLSLHPFALRSIKLIFTNEFEQSFVGRLAPWTRARAAVIPIGSNVPVVEAFAGRRPNTITYFGLIRRQKGLERVLELAKLLQHRCPRWQFRIIGRLMPAWDNYYQELRRQAEGLPVEWKIGLDGEELSRALASSDIAYLPFPDGASERRGSLIALLAHGAAVITTKGAHTPSQIDGAVFFAGSAQDAAMAVELLDKNPERKTEIQRRARLYARKFEWEEIASQHMAVYEQVLTRRRSK